MLRLALVPGLAKPSLSRLISRLGLICLMRRMFAEHGITHVLDVGANTGQYGRMLRRHVGYRGSITSFEPVGSTYERLRSQIRKDPRWTVHRLALSDEAGERQINVMNASELSSLYTPSTSETKAFSGVNTVIRTEVVQTVRLDEFLDGGDDYFLKLDTQGHDLTVLEGANTMLDRICACQIEVSCLRIYEGIPTMSDALRYMDRIGFDLCGLFPIAVVRPNRVVEFDAVFVNRARC